MFEIRWPWAVLFVVVGALQAWDAGVLRASMGIQSLVALAIIVTPLTWGLRASKGIQIASVAVAFALLTVARVAADVPLPTLHLAAFLPAVVVLVLGGLELRARGVER